MNKYLEELKSLGKGEKEFEGLVTYQTKIGDIRKIIKRDKLQGNKELGLELINTLVYDAMIMGYLLINTEDLTYEEIITLSELTDSPSINSQRLSVFVAENSEYERLFTYFKKLNTDSSKILYYASISGRLSIDPYYNQKLYEDELEVIHDTICSQTKEVIKEMNYLVSTIAVQIPELTQKAFDYFNDYSASIKKVTSVNIISRYESAKKNNQLQVKRDSCRC